MPELLIDPPLFRWIAPELGQLSWMFPPDPLLINQKFVGQQPALTPQRLIFEWMCTGDFQPTFDVENATGLGRRCLTRRATRPPPSAGCTGR